MKTNVPDTNCARPRVARGAARSRGLVLLLLFPLLAVQPSCVFVGGYSDEGGWYIWPGSLLLTAAAVAIFFLLSRRRR
jgi:nitrate reductase NapE component